MMELTCEDCGVIFMYDTVTTRCQNCHDSWCDEQDAMHEYEEDDHADRQEAY